MNDMIESDIKLFSSALDDCPVCFIFPSKIVGGHEIMAIELIKLLRQQKEFKKRNFLAYVPIDNLKIKKTLFENEIAYESFKANLFKPEFLHALFNPVYVSRCIRLLRSTPKGSKIIVVQGDILQGLGYFVAGRLLNKTVSSYIPYAHSFKRMAAKAAWLKDSFSTLAYRLCNNYITISKVFEKEIINRNRKAKVLVVHNFVEKTSASFTVREFCVTDVVNIFIIGRVQFHQKGHDVLVEALSGIGEYQIALHVVGDGPDLKNLKNMQGKLPDNISMVFHGWATNSWDVAEKNKIDFLVIPSLFEGVPLVMLEALERNVPIIAAARDGMLDYLPTDSLYDVSGDSVMALRSKIIAHIRQRTPKI
ncbi:glycosyltransferase [Serratia marcescens]|uniref:Glycosyltransferase family 4 protein n=2 Tax=Serratia marcescens TaxID=615 RepID=A0ABD5BCI3_SERMA|nr:glycosyltransferase family 4 protein [Serratia marcescens]AUU08841.1 glycosyl transferase family 1 [Serratia marcescens]MCZ6928441.1 glycosyl transferase family 1 [Serratia marcescens]MDE5234087.1 glycosyltransferase family 4 protein [Serratia marcescens]MDE5257746.1 glycosyltransferase family 4 protein [Serratia marcescens]MDP8599386.1 glycosyltransferase family 4 protein [Serratia marcescens]